MNVYHNTQLYTLEIFSIFVNDRFEPKQIYISKILFIADYEKETSFFSQYRLRRPL